MEVDGAIQKWFYADAGLEAYEKHSGSPWWHQENWVSPVEIDPEDLERILDDVPSGDADDLMPPDDRRFE
jgi:hypothetical protein